MSRSEHIRREIQARRELRVWQWIQWLAIVAGARMN
jgi:hypothetical protein